MHSNPLSDLSPSLLSKIGSIVAHVQELRSPHGNELFDGGAIDALLTDEQVLGWLNDMRALALAPHPRAALADGGRDAG